MARTTRGITSQNARVKAAAPVKSAPTTIKTKPKKEIRPRKKTTTQPAKKKARPNHRKQNVVDNKPTTSAVPVDESLDRRSSDRRKVPVDRYGLTFIFIPKPQSRSPISPVASPVPKAPAQINGSAASSKISKVVTKSRMTAKPPFKSIKIMSQSKRGNVATAKPKPASKSQAPKAKGSSATSEKAKKKPSSPKKPPALPKESKKTVKNRQNSQEPKVAAAVSGPVEIKSSGNADALSVPPAEKKRKRDSSPAAASEKKIKQTIEEVAALAAVDAESESDEGKGIVHPATQKKGKEKDRYLKPKPNLKHYLHEPTFESKDELPFVSVSAYSKLAIRSVLINNETLLKRLIDDVQHVHNLNYKRSVDVPYDAASYALFNGNSKLLQMIIDYENKPKSGRVEPRRSLLGQQSTGNYNFHMLGHAVRQIQMSRGGKEGINALTKDNGNESVQNCWVTRLQVALQRNVSFRLIQQMLLQNVIVDSTVAQHVHEAIRYGHNKLAGSIIKAYGSNLFNELHEQVLLNETEPLKPFRPISVKKKGLCDVTPVHCACINPNEKYLAALMAAGGDYNHSDRNGYRPIHYAAACSSSVPLKLLMQKGAQPIELTKVGENALHRACLSGRAHNVDCIIQYCKTSDPDLAVVKQKSRTGFAPIHFAAKNGHVDCIKALLKFGGVHCDVDQQSGSSANAVTALMLAAEQGYLPTCEYLIKEAGASATKLDKLKRSALAHAVINGMTHVAAFLLRYGVDPDTADSSGNTPVHYAAAYGWYFCLKILIDAGAKLNVTNDWKLTPLAVAYLKGHMALADLLLQQPGIDINCRDDQGMTLVASTLIGTVDTSTIDQLTYLIKEKSADPKPTDASGNTPLHLLAASAVEEKEKFSESMDDVVKMAKLLIENGVDANYVNEAGATAMTIAVETRKLPLAKYLAGVGAKLPPAGSARQNKANVLHHLIRRLFSLPSTLRGDDRSVSAEHMCEKDIFNVLAQNQPTEMMELLQSPDLNGFTPFLLIVSNYSAMKQNEQNESVKSTILDLIGAMLSFSPSLILQRSGRVKSKEENEDDESEVEDETEKESNDDSGSRSSSSDGGSGEESVEENSEAERRRKRVEVERKYGRSALHLLAGCRDPKTVDKQDAVDALLALLDKHMKEHKEIDCSKGRLLDCVDGRGETALFTAVRNGKAEIALRLIEMGCDVKAIRRLPSSSRSKYTEGTWKKDIEKQSKNKKRKRSDDLVDGVSVLMEAVRGRLDTVVERLLRAGADGQATDSEGNTALHYACSISPTNAGIVKQLLEAKADVKKRNKKLRSPLHLACNADTGATDVSMESLACLLNYGADPSVKDVRGRLPLHYAFVKINDHENTSEIDPVALCTVLLPRMADHPQLLNVTDAFGCTPLHYAARRGSNICCMTLLRHSQVDLNAKDKDGNTPLAMAVFHNHMACALTLLQAEADINVGVKSPEKSLTPDDDVWVWSPLQEPKVGTQVTTLSSAVVQREWQGMVYLLIDIFAKKKQSLLPLLEAAVEHKKYNLALTLLRMATAQLSGTSLGSFQRSRGNKNVFHLLANNERPDSSTGSQLQLDVASAILNIGVPTDEHQDDASGPFHPAFYAAKRQNASLLRFFIEKAIETRSLNHYVISSSGHTILTMFLWNVPSGEFESDELILIDDLVKQHGFSLDVLCRYPVPVDFTATDSSTKNYWSDEEALVTPLIHAIHGRSFGIVKSLIKAGADINFADAKGVTPLMHAVRLNEPDIVKLLLNLDYVPTNDEPKHIVKVFRKEGDGQNDADGDDESDETESDSESGTKKKRKKLANARLFNVQGTLAVPESQLSIDGDASGQSESAAGETRKRMKTDPTDSRFNKTSSADLNAVDSDGRNVLHHIVSPFTFGGWSNVGDVLKLLIDLGIDLNRKDRDGFTPLEYAKRSGQFQLVEAMCGRIDDVQKKVDPSWNVGTADDGQEAVTKVGDRVKLEDDAKEYLEKQKAEELERNKAMLAEEARRRKLRPHQLSGYAEIGEIVVDSGASSTDDNSSSVATADPLPYDVLLNKVDFNFGLYGFYNFYRMQLIKRKGSELYIVFTNWGRIGDVGQYQKTPFGKLDDAVKEFKSIFRSKTGNEWTPEIMKKFVQQPKKYRLVNKDDDEKLHEAASALFVTIKLDTSLKSSLPDHLRNFMADVVDVEELIQNAKRLFVRSRFSLTVTALKRGAVLRADAILNEIGDKLNELEKLRKGAHEKEKLDAGLKIYQDLCDLSTEYYFLLPLRGFERTRLPVIDELSKWSEHKSAIELLLKYEIANQMLCAAANRRSELHPFDYIYSATKTRMERFKPDDRDAQTILHYIHNTTDECSKVISIYKLWNEEQSRRYAEVAEKLGNRWLLWHGTRSCNVVSILQAGLLVAPPQALHAGHMFGRGIYAADVFEKSARYCEASRSGKRYAFLCEVALGNVARLADVYGIDVAVDPVPEGYDSVQGVGENVPQPLYDFTLKNGVQIPLGRRIPQELAGNVSRRSWLEHNESIVYNPNQILLRYLVIFK